MLAISLVLYCIYEFLSNRNFPPVGQTLVSLSLLGDFVGVENQLGGVEWTLRLEVLFYFSVFVLLFLQNKSVFRFIKLRIFLIFVSVGVVLFPLFPNGIGTFGYVTIFAPVFLGGIALALYDSKKIGFPLASYLVLVSYAASTSSQTSIRPDTIWAGPILLFGYVIFVFSYALRNRFGSNKLVTTLASYTYTVYLLHKWMIPWIEASLGRFLIHINELFIQVLAVGIFLGLVHVLVTRIEQPIVRWSREVFDSDKSRIH